MIIMSLGVVATLRDNKKNATDQPLNATTYFCGGLHTIMNFFSPATVAAAAVSF